MMSVRLCSGLTASTTTTTSPMLLSLSSTTTNSNMETKTELARDFRFVPYGSSFQDDDDDDRERQRHSIRPTISCDGRVPGGVTLELTHWTDNQTPDELYADTSTEMALKLPIDDDQYRDAYILNNHYDTDGVLSVWACLRPHEARQYATLLREGAEAGDFGEWSSDLGVKLDCTICAMNTNDEAAAYENVLLELPNILHDLTMTGGTAYEELWGPAWQHACRSYDAVCSGEAAIESGPDGIVVSSEPFPLSAYALHRALKEESSGLYARTRRILRKIGNKIQGGGRVSFVYEKPGHGWVKRLVTRHPIPDVADTNFLVEQLNTRSPNNIQWKTGGPSGLVGICYTGSIDAEQAPSAESVAEVLSRLDKEGCA